MSFIWPEMLWLLLLVPLLVLLYWWVLRRKKKAVVGYANLSIVREAMGPGQRFRRHVPPLLFLFAIALADAPRAVVAEAEMGHIELRHRDRDKIATLAADHLAVRDILS